jgi:hypothetical protein
MFEKFVSMVANLRELQKEYADVAVHLDTPDRNYKMAVLLRELAKAEKQVDDFIVKHINEQLKLDDWINGKAIQADEVFTLYNARDEKAQESKA